MKIHLVSDLHMEFAPIELTNPGADTLILSGDILTAEYFHRSKASPYALVARAWIRWFEDLCAQYNHVVYVLGNHEHYKYNFYETADLLKRVLEHIPNLHILDNETVLLDGVKFFGSTLWTDFDGSMYKQEVVRSGMNDYKLITGRTYRKLVPAETYSYHTKAKQAFHGTGATVFVGHHAPSYKSIHPKYEKYGPLNAGYASHMDSFIEAHPEIKLWTHGHVHSSFDYHIGGTRIIANPRGYAKPDGSNPENEEFNPNLILEI